MLTFKIRQSIFYIDIGIFYYLFSHFAKYIRQETIGKYIALEIKHLKYHKRKDQRSANIYNSNIKPTQITINA